MYKEIIMKRFFDSSMDNILSTLRMCLSTTYPISVQSQITKKKADINPS